MQQSSFETGWKISSFGLSELKLSADLPKSAQKLENYVIQKETPIKQHYLYVSGSRKYDFQDSSDLDSCLNSTEIVNKLLLAKGAWGVVYYRPDLNSVFLGRDVYGRLSLVFKRSENYIIISCCIQSDSPSEWFEIPHGSISILKLEQLDRMSFHTLIGAYPDETDRPWRDLFENVDIVHNMERNSMLEVSSTVPCVVTPREYGRQLFDRLVTETRELLNGDDEQTVAVGFSGGVDSTLIALALNEACSRDVAIDLINVAFGDNEKACSQAPDRKRAMEQFAHFQTIFPYRKWRLLLADIQKDELVACRERWISRAAAPAISILDDSLSCVLWFALRLKGREFESGEIVSSPSSSVFVGSGADELFAGYARHRHRFEKDGAASVAEECASELLRLGARNGGRDARVAAQHSRLLRSPLLEDDLVEWANSLPIEAKADLSLPRGYGEKRIIREALALFSAPNTAPKQAMQFGSRMAKLDNGGKDVKGSDISSNLRR